MNFSSKLSYYKTVSLRLIETAEMNFSSTIFYDVSTLVAKHLVGFLFMSPG